MDDWLNASARKAEREWQRLCDAYLPIRVKGSIWRYSRNRIRGDLSQGWIKISEQRHLAALSPKSTEAQLRRK
jgi:hypothetical protein